jgi:DNA-binding FadR family transcriptional regulator
MPRLPDLAGGYGVNRDTLARAVAILEGEGLVRRCPGRGTIVRWHVRAAAVAQPGDGQPLGRFRQWRRRISVRPGSPCY